MPIPADDIPRDEGNERRSEAPEIRGFFIGFYWLALLLTSDAEVTQTGGSACEKLLEPEALTREKKNVEEDE